MINIKSLSFVLAFFAYLFVCERLNAQKTNQFDENNKRTGVWIKYYSNKKIRYTGKFKNGKEIGEFKFYDISSSDYPVIKKTFYKDSDSIFVQFQTVTGEIETEGFFIDRARVGNWKYFFPDGELMSEENYKNGKLDGKQLIYYPNGQVTEFAVYKNGLKHGVISKYSNKGVLIEEITYQDDQQTGLAKYFELNGDLKETGHYLNGKRVGKWEYYMEGEIATNKELKKKKTTYTKKKAN